MIGEQNMMVGNLLFEHIKDDDLLFIFIFGKSAGEREE